MERRTFARRPHGSVEVDLCHACHVMWLDQYESAQLTPGAVIELFGVLHADGDTASRPLSGNAACPHCRTRLVHTHDIQRTNRITYQRCPSGCGRLTTFFQFLREKEFVRTLKPAEVERLRAQVAQVRCSSCGAPLELEREPACRFCRARISILDPDAVRRTLAELGAQEHRRATVDPAAALDAILAGQGVRRRLARAEGRHVAGGATDGGGSIDLVSEALDFLMEQLR